MPRAYDWNHSRSALTGTVRSVNWCGSTSTYGLSNAGLLSSSTSSYTYDDAGLRASKTPAGPTLKSMVWDVATGSVPNMLSDGSTYCVYGPGGIPIEQITGSTTTYLYGDQLGSTVLITNSTGASAGTYSYDPFGATKTHSGSTVSALLYAGQYRDTESALYYLRARYYDPATSGFLSVDPLQRPPVAERRSGSVRRPAAEVNGHNSTSTTMGAWSLVPLPLRASRSTYASVTASANDGEPNTKSMRMPRFFGNASWR